MSDQTIAKRYKLVGFTAGAFDLLHPGHLYFLSECSKRCDELWVGLHTDPSIDRPTTKSKPVQSVFERFTQLSSTKFVSQVIPYDTENDLINMMGVLDIDIRFLGSDYKNQPITGLDNCQTRGIVIEYINRAHDYSSSGLRSKIRKG